MSILPLCTEDRPTVSVSYGLLLFSSLLDQDSYQGIPLRVDPEHETPGSGYRSMIHGYCSSGSMYYLSLSPPILLIEPSFGIWRFFRHRFHMVAIASRVGETNRS